MTDSGIITTGLPTCPECQRPIPVYDGECPACGNILLKGELETKQFAQIADVLELINEFIERERERDWKGSKNRIDAIQELHTEVSKND